MIKLLLNFIVIIHLLNGCSAIERRDMNTVQEGLRLIDQGTLHLRAGRFNEARASFELALEIDRSSAAYDGLGCIAFLTGNLPLAEKFFQAAIEIDPEYGDVFANLALMYESVGDVAAAKRLYSIALSKRPNAFKARNNLAALLYDNRLEDEARIEILKARSIESHPIIEENLIKME